MPYILTYTGNFKDTKDAQVVCCSNILTTSNLHNGKVTHIRLNMTDTSSGKTEEYKHYEINMTPEEAKSLVAWINNHLGV